jgi:hypothetical protein
MSPINVNNFILHLTVKYLISGEDVRMSRTSYTKYSYNAANCRGLCSQVGGAGFSPETGLSVQRLISKFLIAVNVG